MGDVLRNTILVLYPRSFDPRPFIRSLVDDHPAAPEPERSAVHEEDEDENEDEDKVSLSSAIPWSIDNKYYTAAVQFLPVAVESCIPNLYDEVEVVMYLFSQPITSLPGGLVSLMAEPRDISLAIRVSIPSPGSSAGVGVGVEASETSEEMFDEIGMEYLDGGADDEDDDERPISLEERVRQTLMTHMWPGMMRKEIGVRGMSADSEDPELELEQEAEHGESGPVASGSSPAAGTPGRVVFPIRFSATATATAVSNGDGGSFPDIQALKDQVMLADLDTLRGDRLERLFASTDPDDHEEDDEGEEEGDELRMEEEYARLDDWLDTDGEGEEEQNTQSSGQDQDRPQEDDGDGVGQPQDEWQEVPIPRPVAPAEGEAEAGFEDDFSDFYSAPAPSLRENDRKDPNLPMDPTPLLLHLQAVREELAGLEDEDVRRVRAGKEVMDLMRSLGMGGGWEDIVAELEDET